VRVSFDLSDRDMRYFRDRLREASAGGSRDEESIAKSAAALVDEAIATGPPEFVRDRLLRLTQLIQILRDPEWRLEGRDRARIVDALAYFVDPDDLIPDRVPGLGYLDDAIMIELVVDELKHDIKAYEDFCAFRSEGPAGHDGAKMETRRKGLQARMRRRRSRQRDDQRGRSGSGKSPIGLW
jgi:hypothetical protein